MNIENIELFFDKNVRPSLASHGGNVQIIGFTNNQLKLKLIGACSVCPASHITMKKLISGSIEEKFPEVKDAIAIEGVSGNLIKQAKDILKRRNKK
ncbi:MAG: NifU family protein [Firmicutes bacterium]|nr:NifU family protein [Bacillota bacterium]